MKVGDLVRHRDRPVGSDTGIVINTSTHDKPKVLVDVHWTKWGRTVCAYTPNELVVVNEGR
jgi:hypothetical protein